MRIPTAAQITAVRHRLESVRSELAVKHEFRGKRSQHFKKCVVIRWKHRKRKDRNFIDYERINSFVDFAHALCEKYDLQEPDSPLCETDLLLAKIGIYCFHEWSHKGWAIPNENAEVLEHVLNNIPSWAHITKKA